MILTLKVTDELYEEIGKLNPANPRHAAEMLLARYASNGYSAKSVILSTKDLAEVQKIVGQVDDPASLIKALKKLASVAIGDVEVELSEGQMSRIKSNAKYYDRKVEDFAKQEIKRGLVTSLGV